LRSELPEEGPTGVYKDDGPFGDKIIFVSKVLDVRMGKSGRSDGPPTVRLGTENLRCLEDYHGRAPNLLDNSLNVW